MILQKALDTDLQAVCELYQRVCAAMEANGQRQWHWGDYPNAAMIADSLAAGTLYCCKDESGVYAAITVDCEQAPEYAQLNWLFGVKPGLFHRLAVDPQHQHSGVGRTILNEVQDILRDMGCDSLRCDTYMDNVRAMRCYITMGMRTPGKINLNGRPKKFICFEKRLTEDCPLLPQPMIPAFRGGSLTPWGGEKLLQVYGKPIQELPAGESLEASCIPNLESKIDTSESLPVLIKTYGSAFAGKYANQAFPLLLKFIDAKQSLSVQVHPDDEYAAEYERGKLGKSEAWLVLNADEGAQLVYGLKPGVTKEQLKTASENGKEVEALLNFLPVHSGDVVYIPAGCVHAIGAGVMVYEIQQSSDITYRFYDWDRVDASGNRRELHLKKALDVTDLGFHGTIIPQPVPTPVDQMVRVVDEQYFTLDLMTVEHQVALGTVNEFAFLTVLDGGLTLCWQSGCCKLTMGETVYLPTTAPALTLKGNGRAALSMPR